MRVNMARTISRMNIRDMEFRKVKKVELARKGEYVRGDKI